jgi:hypothetical protein
MNKVINQSFENVTVHWKDGEEPFSATVSIGIEYNDQIEYATDERVFFYCIDQADFDRLLDPNNSEEFYLTKDND